MGLHTAAIPGISLSRVKATGDRVTDDPPPSPSRSETSPMTHGLRGVGLLVLIGAVGCTAPEKIASPRLQLPPPQLPPASPTAITNPASTPTEVRNMPRPIATSATAPSEIPTPGQAPVINPPALGTLNPATMPLSPAASKVPGRGTNNTPTVSPAPPTAVHPVLTPTGLSNPVDVNPPQIAPAPPPLKPIEVVPPAMPTPQPPR